MVSTGRPTDVHVCLLQLLDLLYDAGEQLWTQLHSRVTGEVTETGRAGISRNRSSAAQVAIVEEEGHYLSQATLLREKCRATSTSCAAWPERTCCLLSSSSSAGACVCTLKYRVYAASSDHQSDINLMRCSDHSNSTILTEEHRPDTRSRDQAKMQSYCAC